MPQNNRYSCAQCSISTALPTPNFWRISVWWLDNVFALRVQPLGDHIQRIAGQQTLRHLELAL